MRPAFLSAAALSTAAALLVACGAASDEGAKTTTGATPGAGRHGGAGDERGGHRAEAHVYAATSLRDVVDQAAKNFEPIRGSHVVASYGGSNVLAEQLHQGATPGVFVSASVEWVDKLEGWGLVEPGSRVDLASNTLVVVVPKDARLRPSKIEDLADAKFARIALADPGGVPAGKYAKAALEKAGVFEAVKGRVVATQDVRTALAYAERGEVSAAVVYGTDAAASTTVDVAVRVPSELHPKILYPMVLVKGANRREHELHEYLKSPEAWAVFEKAGFTKP